MADTSIRVIARFRPISDREKKEFVEGKESVLLEFRDEHTVQLTQGQGKEPLMWTFDRVFHGKAAQSDIFHLAAKETVEDVLKGYNGTIFAYGQTGSGKSHTMMGPDITNDELCGIIPRACQYIFEHISKNPDHCEFKVTCSFLEIYKEVIKDLLNPKGVNLKVRETPTRGVWVEGLSEQEVDSHLKVLQLLHQGEEHRAVASTNMNSVSSRSHSLFILTVTQKTRDGAIKIGKLNLADLAGSEKVGKTGASGETLEEAKKINQSLSALGNCIMALTKNKKQHVPYRDSKLTFILRESLGGNTKTTLLIACSPHSFNLEETVSTLRFGQRAKTIKNKVKINAQRSVAELELIVKKLTKEIKVLKKYSTKLEAELANAKGPDFDMESLKRKILEEASIGSTKISRKNALSDQDSISTPVKALNSNELDDEDEAFGASKTGLHDGYSSASTSPRLDHVRKASTDLSRNFSLASLSPSIIRSSTSSNLKTPTKFSLHHAKDDLDVHSNVSSANSTPRGLTPSRSGLYLDGILNDDDGIDTMALLDAQLEYNRMKENLTLQIQDMVEEMNQIKEDRDLIQQQGRLQVAKLQEENAALKEQLEMLKSAGSAQNNQQSSSPKPAVEEPDLTQTPAPLGPIKINLDTTPLGKEAADPVFMARQMFHWMVLATKLELFAQGKFMKFDVDMEVLFGKLVNSNVSTQQWPNMIWRELEPPKK